MSASLIQMCLCFHQITWRWARKCGGEGSSNQSGFTVYSFRKWLNALNWAILFSPRQKKRNNLVLGQLEKQAGRDRVNKEKVAGRVPLHQHNYSGTVIMTLRLTSASQKQQDEPVKVSVWVLDDFQIHPHSDSGLCCAAIFMITITKSQNLLVWDELRT